MCVGEKEFFTYRLDQVNQIRCGRSVCVLDGINFFTLRLDKVIKKNEGLKITFFFNKFRDMQIPEDSMNRRKIASF